MSKFVYVTYIKTTREKLWNALIQPEFTKAYWYGSYQESTWKKGAKWELKMPDGGVADQGEVLEIEPQHRLVLKWRNEFRPELKDEGYTRCTMELAQDGDAIKLTVTHEIDAKDSRMIDGVSNGWPKILSSLKSLLETGESLPDTGTWPKQ
jgi:uncharacterized protein YndB with AHSA1/START domain